MKTCPVAKALLVNSQGELLLLRRSKTAPRRPLEWDLPGGLVEEGEEFGAALSREIEEETGLTLDTHHLDVAYGTTLVKEGMNVVYLFFVARTPSETITLSYEHDLWKWVPFQQALKEIKYPLHRELLGHIINNNLLPDLPL